MDYDGVSDDDSDGISTTTHFDVIGESNVENYDDSWFNQLVTHIKRSKTPAAVCFLKDIINGEIRRKENELMPIVESVMAKVKQREKEI